MSWCDREDTVPVTSPVRSAVIMFAEKSPLESLLTSLPPVAALVAQKPAALFLSRLQQSLPEVEAVSASTDPQSLPAEAWVAPHPLPSALPLAVDWKVVLAPSQVQDMRVELAPVSAPLAATLAESIPVEGAMVVLASAGVA